MGHRSLPRDPAGADADACGEIFAALTLGSFRKLTVDFDSEPLALHGLRADGATVGIAGMSDGTRD